MHCSTSKKGEPKKVLKQKCIYKNTNYFSALISQFESTKEIVFIESNLPEHIMQFLGKWEHNSFQSWATYS